jgi:hypothetical protein
MHREPTDINPKVYASVGGGSVGVALGEILVYLIERFSGDIPTGIEAAIVVVVTAALAFAAGYLKSE